MNSLQTIAFLGVLLGLALAIPQNLPQNSGQIASSGGTPQDSKTVKEALDLSAAVIQAFAEIPSREDSRSASSASLQESEDAILRIMESSRRTIEQSERRGYSVPADARERLDAAAASIPATFEFLKKLQGIGANSGSTPN
ncbi:uncharacterized protein [Macrobrachium rosenbergii]|uniref:uncharacterized protein n=1 Tax=Macrobrachium rosenbergii TaxID=79674 RepID=UPI0034D3D5D2